MRRFQGLTLFVLLFTLGACAGAPKKTGAAVTLTHDDSRVGTYVSSPKGFTTSSYWIEGPDGLILIDTQFLSGNNVIKL